MDPVSNFCIELNAWLFRLFGLASLVTLLAQICWWLVSGKWHPVSVVTFVQLGRRGAEPEAFWLGYLADFPLSGAFAVLSVAMLPVLILVAVALAVVRRMR